MQDIRIEFISGTMAGESRQVDLGVLIIGREPHAQPGQVPLVLRGADSAVSRDHVRIAERDGGAVVLHNLGANGTVVNGKLIQDDIVLEPGAKIAIGSNHEFSVQWQQVGAAAAKKPSKPSVKVASAGPLASPLVRTVLAVYLLAIVGVAAWLSWGGGKNDEIADDWPQLSEEYAAYEPEGVDEREKARRARFAEAMLVRLRVFRANDRQQDIRRLCRELMRLDSDIESPLYRYGARCLGDVD